MKQEQLLEIGKYTLYPHGEGRIWIAAEDGEGGSFPESELIALIGKYYEDNF